MSKHIFADVYKDYNLYASKRHKKQGFETLQRNFKLHILPYFENKYIEDLLKIDIINWQTEILSKNFSNSFNNSLYYEFSSFMKYCVYCSYIRENIVLSVDKFKKRIEKKKYYTYNIWQFRRFRRKLNNYIDKQYFNFLFFCGPRPSEAMALRFSNLEGIFAHIGYSIHRRGKRELDTPKNQSSIRDIKLSLLMRFRFWRLKRLYIKKYGDPNCDYFVFGGIKPLSSSTIDRHKKKACEKAHIREITQHQFRHSCATRLINIGVPLDNVSKLLGHSKVSTTVDVYLHTNKKKRANNTLFPKPFFF